MSWRERIGHELKAVGITTLYFGAWIGSLMLFKVLVLSEYSISFSQWSRVLVGALVLSKVVLILEHVRLGDWEISQPAWLHLLVRTALYSAGVALVLVLEHGFEGRAEYGGFLAAVGALSKGMDGTHLLLNSLTVSSALLGYNFVMLLRRHLGPGGIRKILMAPLPVMPESAAAAKN